MGRHGPQTGLVQDCLDSAGLLVDVDQIPGKNRQKTFAKIQKKLIKSILENDEKYQPPLESIKRGISESVPY